MAKTYFLSELTSFEGVEVSCSDLTDLTFYNMTNSSKKNYFAIQLVPIQTSGGVFR